MEKERKIKLNIPANDGKPLAMRDERGRVLPGSVLNPTGITGEKPDFMKDAEEAISEIAKINNISREEAKKRFMLKMMNAIMAGEFPYWKDFCDRYYGKPREGIDVNHQGKIIILDK